MLRWSDPAGSRASIVICCCGEMAKINAVGVDFDIESMRTHSTEVNQSLGGRRMSGLAPRLPRPISCAAFTIVEVLLGSGVLAIMGISLYAGFTFGIQQIRSAQENIRATQILEEKMELARLVNWNQVANLPGYIPKSFQEAYYSTNATNVSGGLVYYGSVLVTNAPVKESYSNDLKMIQVTVNWTNYNRPHTRTMSTFVSQYGMQNYVY